jgi:chromosome segregation protein
MHFRRLRLAGFKSFVEPAELRIEPGLTGVVGPNGCGKSNLLEAIRWVMGEGSPKSLRGGGMEDVIFAGTATRPAREFADVTLLLDNDARTAAAMFNDSDTIEVVRRIERGLGSAYRLNGRDVRQRDVQLLFADAATGAHSPALVSQGRIGSIIAAKPAERRVLLEEAAGISGLHVRRKEAEIRLRAAEANLMRLDDVMKAIEVQLATLRRQARQAERYRQIADRIRLVEAQLLFARWRAAADAAAAARAAAAAADAQVTEATRDVARLSTDQANAAAALPGLRDAEAGAAAAWQALVQAANAAATELASVEARRRELGATAATIARDMQREEALAQDAATAIDRLAAEAEALRARVETARAGIPSAAKSVADAEHTAGAHETALGAAIEAHARAAAQAKAASSALESVRARLARAEDEAARLQRDLTGVTASDDTGRAKADADAATARAADDLAATTAAIAAAETARGAAESARETAQDAWLAARGVHAALAAEAAALTRQLGGGDSRARTSVAESIIVATGFEAALAAALGDDLAAGLGATAGGRFWELAEGSGDVALPDGAAALADHVKAPAELARRLRQVGVVADDAAASLALRLAPGQRLVTRDGRLWRWDGYRAFGGQGQAAAERFVARNRLAEVGALVPEAEAALAAAVSARDGADSDMRRWADAERAARTARAAAERALDTARDVAVRAEAESQRRNARIEAMRGSIARLIEEAAGHARDVEAARAAADLAVDLPALAAQVTTVRAEAESARAALATSRAAVAVLTRDIDGDTARLSAAIAERDGWTQRRQASAAQRGDLDARASAAAAEIDALTARPAAIAARQSELATQTQTADAARAAASDTLRTAEAALRDIDSHVRTASESLASAREARATATANADHAETRRGEFAATSDEHFGCPPRLLPETLGFEPAAAGLPDDLAGALETLIADRERIGPVNLRAETELAEIEAQQTGSAAERDELETAIARLRGSIGALNREGRVRLLEAFKIVDTHFRDLFSTLFAGGAAHLELIESDDPLEAGLEIMAQPPGKKLQSLTLLSGGEQALTAVALIFGLFLTNPAPICVLDEVDAPLDDANVERFCDLLDRMAATTATRFLIVTHNAVTMSRMHRLYGVTMVEQGVSQLVSVDLARAELLVAAQ